LLLAADTSTKRPSPPRHGLATALSSTAPDAGVVLSLAAAIRSIMHSTAAEGDLARAALAGPRDMAMPGLGRGMPPLQRQAAGHVQLIRRSCPSHRHCSAKLLGTCG